MQTNIEDNVITLFRQKGFEKHENLTEQIVSRVFNDQSENILHAPFKYDMLMELVNQCRCEKLELTPRGIGQIISEAHTILAQRLKALQGDSGLINERKLLLKNLKDKAAVITGTAHEGFYEKQQMNQIMRDHQVLQKELEQLQKNEKIFTQEFVILDELFRKNMAGKRKRDGDRSSYVEPDPKNLVSAFYLSIVGLCVQFFAVLVRPGYTGIIIFLQVLFLVLIGYYHKKAVMLLILSGVTSIILDLVGIFLFQVFSLAHVLYLNPNDVFHKIMNYIYIAALIISILLRGVTLLVCYSFIEPPIKKISYTVCKVPLTLNIRLRSNSVRGSLSIQTN